MSSEVTRSNMQVCNPAIHTCALPPQTKLFEHPFHKISYQALAGSKGTAEGVHISLWKDLSTGKVNRNDVFLSFQKQVKHQPSWLGLQCSPDSTRPGSLGPRNCLRMLHLQASTLLE